MRPAGAGLRLGAGPPAGAAVEAGRRQFLTALAGSPADGPGRGAGAARLGLRTAGAGAGAEGEGGPGLGAAAAAAEAHRQEEESAEVLLGEEECPEEEWAEAHLDES